MTYRQLLILVVAIVVIIGAIVFVPMIADSVSQSQAQVEADEHETETPLPPVSTEEPDTTDEAQGQIAVVTATPTPQVVVVTSTPIAEQQMVVTATSTSLGIIPTMTMTPVVNECRDGELVLVHAADNGNQLSRLPVGEAERVDILELSWPGEGFGGLDRAIIVIPRQGNVWQVHLVAGTETIATRGFCGDNSAIASWAVQAHVPSLAQASRDTNGNEPSHSEIGVYILNFEERSLRIVDPASAANAPTPEEVLDWITVTFNDNGTISSVPMTVIR